MSTETITTTTIPATRLADMLDQAAPHSYQWDDRPELTGIHLDSDSTYLHAVASDRYTLAVARGRLYSGTAWTATISGPHVQLLKAWVAAQNDLGIVLTADPGQLSLSSNSGSVTLPTVTDREFPNWRALFNKHLQQDQQPVDVSSLNTHYLDRWQQAGQQIHLTQAAPDAPIIVHSDGLIGMQMPTRPWRNEPAPNSRDLAAEWASSFGLFTDPLTEFPLPDTTNTISDMTRDLLRQVVASSSDLYEAVGGIDHAATAAHALSGCNAWMAYRLLQALQSAAPGLAEKALRDVADELEGGEFSQTAFEDAAELGHDPNQWQADHEARRKADAAA
ncbi:hypothetical protein [Kitasatospora cineracea]|uniref:DNA polymerase III beta subunit-like protein n=1 Tax=Kitasatospora cineracea TaxID=88074 RepID=A0A3N4SES3_9ACTN|nr:hypothetical protein [Kitasatospora cineracea]RPE34964.1 hypothetical protein EDD38_3307 [Kitasatospora cineracea]